MWRKLWKLAGGVMPARLQASREGRVAGDHPAPVIDVAADLAVLLGPRHGVAVEADLAAQGLEIARQRLVVARPVGADETARAREAAPDAPAFDHLGEARGPARRDSRLAQHGCLARRPSLPCSRSIFDARGLPPIQKQSPGA